VSSCTGTRVPGQAFAHVPSRDLSASERVSRTSLARGALFTEEAALPWVGHGKGTKGTRALLLVVYPARTISAARCDLPHRRPTRGRAGEHSTPTGGRRPTATASHTGATGLIVLRLAVRSSLPGFHPLDTYQAQAPESELDLGPARSDDGDSRPPRTTPQPPPPPLPAARGARDRKHLLRTSAAPMPGAEFVGLAVMATAAVGPPS